MFMFRFAVISYYLQSSNHFSHGKKPKDLCEYYEISGEICTARTSCAGEHLSTGTSWHSACNGTGISEDVSHGLEVGLEGRDGTMSNCQRKRPHVGCRSFGAKLLTVVTSFDAEQSSCPAPDRLVSSRP